MSASNQGQVNIPPLVFITCSDKETDIIYIGDTLQKVLDWIGFQTNVQNQSFVGNAFRLFKALKVLTNKDIENIPSNFSIRTANKEWIRFFTRRTKHMNSLTHWVLDFFRVSKHFI